MSGTDINRYILNERAVERDPEGYMNELEPWSPELAEKRALEQGIMLTDEHWEVIHFLRERFQNEGQAKSGRHVVEALQRQFAGSGGKRYLYTLFPHGPVNQGSQIAGLPLPAYTADRGFGSSE